MVEGSERRAPMAPVSYDVPEWFNMVTSLVDHHVEEGRGGNPAIYYEDEVLTYADLLAAVNRVGNVLRGIGVRREERVAILMADRPEFVTTFLGAMKIGAVPLPIHTAYTGASLAYPLSDSRATALVVDSALLPRVEEIRCHLPELAHVVVHGWEPADGPLDPARYVSFEGEVAAASVQLESARTHRDDPSYWLYSSGTERKPKAVIHLHQDMVHCVGRWLEAVGMPTSGEIHYSASKLFYSYGLV